jgi:choline dehydrogenase-like flavoprotein
MDQYWVKEKSLKTNEKELIFNQAFHPSGTVQAGPVNGDSITDQYGKLYEFKNSWVASSAIFPTSGWSNPSLLIMAYSALVVRQIFNKERN